ncbi:hypothetical protein NM688_g322 [Phlebia brevispora]|uniref:Uncharacterized protein n=1 Tax=Phlebia brevispora TaxID=194682 RepID=A0ACC1TEY2_9APHY|nr:hypothetical protein NM688_g322 [Phlebia brevispora]
MLELYEKWKGITNEEKKTVIAKVVLELEECKESVKYAPHNVYINSFHGTAQATKEKKLRQLKHDCSALIFEKLTVCAVPDQIGHMNYANFNQITKKYEIIFVSWLLKHFTCFSDLKTKMELDILYNS